MIRGKIFIPWTEWTVIDSLTLQLQTKSYKNTEGQMKSRIWSGEELELYATLEILHGGEVKSWALSVGRAEKKNVFLQTKFEITSRSVRGTNTPTSLFKNDNRTKVFFISVNLFWIWIETHTECANEFYIDILWSISE
jgi:hypothetical protein